MVTTTLTPAARSAIAYGRVSSEGQARDGISLDAQAERLRAYAVAHGLGAIDVRIETKTAKTIAGRPVLQEILENVRSGRVRAVLVFKLDRLARNTVEALELANLLREHDCRLISLSETIDTGSAFGTFFFTVLAALAQMERDQIAERVRVVLAFKKAQGAKLGSAPTGWKKAIGEDGKLTALVRDEGGQEVLSRVRVLRSEGRTLRAIGAILEAEAVPAPRGASRWNISTLSRLVTRIDAPA
jgi:site-specific DNA recombinase